MMPAVQRFREGDFAPNGRILSPCPCSEWPKLSADDSEEDQIAISTVHETMLAGTSLGSKAQSTEHTHRPSVIGEDTRMDPVKPELPESGGDDHGRRLRSVSLPPVRAGNPVSDVSIPVVQPDLVETASTESSSLPRRMTERLHFDPFFSPSLHRRMNSRAS